jgi:protein arginine N-methyltransferase 2
VGRDLLWCVCGRSTSSECLFLSFSLDTDCCVWGLPFADTYSEHYSDLHAFFQSLPDLLSISDHARFSFFHGLGATSRLLYDVYTTVSELHLREVGLVTSWDEVDVVPGREAVDRWSSTGIKGGAVDEKKYWAESMVGQYRLPVCRLGM